MKLKALWGSILTVVVFGFAYATVPVAYRTFGSAGSPGIFVGNGALVTGVTAAAIAAEDVLDGTLGAGVTATTIADQDTSKITTGVFGDARIPNLDTSKVTTGIFDVSHVPDMDTAKITSGQFSASRLADLDTSKVTTGVFADARIPSLDTSKISSGVFGSSYIPTLDTTKITGTFLEAMLAANQVGTGKLKWSAYTGPADSAKILCSMPTGDGSTMSLMSMTAAGAGSGTCGQ
jgi:hypothetical protein